MANANKIHSFGHMLWCTQYARSTGGFASERDSPQIRARYTNKWVQSIHRYLSTHSQAMGERECRPSASRWHRDWVKNERHTRILFSFGFIYREHENVGTANDKWQTSSRAPFYRFSFIFFFVPTSPTTTWLSVSFILIIPILFLIVRISNIAFT